MADAEQKVLVDYLALSGAQDKKIAHIILNKASALNALDLDMVNAMLQALEGIRDDDSVVALVLDSSNDKAFCAGGDVVSMYHAMKESAQIHSDAQVAPTPAFLKDFFTQEYRLDYCLHTFPKPVIVWGNGIIMGGGLGLFMGAHIKLVTETARIAMPEITIGLFPDVGGSYFLNRLPTGVGSFLGLTAASINAQDTALLGMSDAIVPHASKTEFLQRLCALENLNKESVLELAASFRSGLPALSEANLATMLDPLASLGQCESMLALDTRLKSMVSESAENVYLQKALKSYEQGSAITAHLVFEQLKRAQALSLAECFRMELSMAFTCGAQGEFQEGVRALLIDKDRSPQWQYSQLGDVPQALINMHFSKFTNNAVQSHPLAHLEQDFGV